MKFVRAMWKLLVGVKDALVLIVMLMFFGVIFAALSAKPKPLGEGVLDVALAGTVVEQPQRMRLADALGDQQVEQFALPDVVAALAAAKSDGKVKAVALDLDGFMGGGQSAMIQLADAVRDVRQSGKPVLAYATVYTDDSYMVASAASEIWLNPMGGVGVAGPGGTQLFYKGLLDKLGVTANVYRVGTYKSAVEPFIRNDMSPEAKENMQSLADALLADWQSNIQRLRPKAKIDAALNDLNGLVAAADGDLAKASLNAGLVDKLAPRDQWQARLAEIGGEGDDATTPYKAIDLGRYMKAHKPGDRAAKVGVVTVAGMIIDGDAGPGTAGGDTIADLIDTAVDDGMEALVLRVDSPGGSVTASERIRQALLSAKKKDIPIVVSMGNVAASGGYWVSTPANFIYAEPSTLTGSIGVFMVLPSFKGTLDKLGIGTDTVKTTPLSAEPNLLDGPSAQFSQLLQANTESIYRHFLAIVAASRHRTPAQIDQVAQGRVWAGGAARQLGLVDGFGNLGDAIAKAADLAKLDDKKAARFYSPERSFEEELVDMLVGGDRGDGGGKDAYSALAVRQERQMIAALGDAQAILSGPAIQARCLECGALASAAAPTAGRETRLLDVLKALVLG